MRKTLLMNVMLLASAGAMAQSSVPQAKSDVANKSVKYKRYSKAVDAFGSQAELLTAPGNTRATTTTVLGTSTYSLQTNASICTRITNNSDGTRSMTWTWSNTGGSFTDRGTGYVYFNGTSNSAAPAARVESIRTGWPSIGVLGDNSEVLLSHISTPGYGLMFSKRAVKGTGAWTENTTALTNAAATYGNIWGRMAVGGTTNNTLHVISLTYPTDAGGTIPYLYNGQQGAIIYSRSQDGGATWDIQNQVNAQHDNTQYYGFDGDGYAIDASGNTVAYVSGSFTTDLFLMKSTDNGNTWTKTVIMQFPIPLCNDCLTDVNGDQVIDTVNHMDGSVAVLIDNAGMCHVWTGAMRVLDDDSTDNSTSYFPGTNGLLYWNEGMGASAPVTITGALDYDGNLVLDLPAAPAGVFPFGVYQVSLSGLPHAGINAAGDIFLSYSAVVENTDINSKALRNVYAMMSDDGGTTWSPASRIAGDDYKEQVFASVARKVDGCVHYLYQQDDYPGHGIGAGNQDATDNTGVVNEMYYACVNPAEVAAGNIGIHPVNVDMINNILVYPNPAEDMITVEIGLLNQVRANIRLVTVTGQEVMAEQVQLIEGNNFMQVDLTGMAKGVYMLNVTAGSVSKTQRVVIK